MYSYKFCVWLLFQYTYTAIPGWLITVRERMRCYHNGNTALIRGERGVAVEKIHVAIWAQPRSYWLIWNWWENFNLTNRNAVALERQHGFFHSNTAFSSYQCGVAIMVTTRSFAHSYQSTWNGCTWLVEDRLEFDTTFYLLHPIL